MQNRKYAGRLPQQVRVVRTIGPARNGWRAVYIGSVLAVVGATIAYLELYGISPDRQQYSIFFDTLRLTGTSILSNIRFEAGFTSVANALVSDELALSNEAVYAIFVFFCLLAKGFVFGKRAQTLVIAALVAGFYFARFFPLHELTQLRAACAISCLMMAFHFKYEGRIVKTAFFSLIALTFHNSTFFAIPAIFIPPMSLRTLVLAGISMLMIILYFAEEIIGFAINSVSSVAYLQNTDLSEHVVNLLNPTLLLDYALLITAFLHWNYQTRLMKQVIVLQVIGLIIMLGTVKFPIVAFRLQDLFSTFWVFYYIEGLRLQKTRLYCLIFIAVNVAWFTFLYLIQTWKPFFS